MDILYLAGREISYMRNDVLLRAFQRLGRVTLCADSTPGSILGRSASLSLRAWEQLRLKEFDLVFVGFFGHLLMLPISRLTRSPVLFDAFVSAYDTLCFDRQVFSPRSPLGRLAFWLDQSACQRASQVLLDTPLQVDYFVRTFHLSPERVHDLAVGCNEDLFAPHAPAPKADVTRVLYYTTYQPLHGVDTVVRAAALLSSESQIQFKIIGAGRHYARIRRLATELDLCNTTFIPTVPVQALPAEISAADICLGGHFGTSAKSGRVIPGKIYQILAMERPLIAGDTPANRDLITHGETALLCIPGSPEALAAAISKLDRDSACREHLAAAGRKLYLERCSEDTITRQLHELLRLMENNR